MSEPVKKPEAVESGAAEPNAVSRRKIVQAGLIAVPVLMTLPTVPAWARQNSSARTCVPRPGQQVCSQSFLQENPNFTKKKKSQGGFEQGEGLFGAPATDDPFGKNPFQQ